MNKKRLEVFFEFLIFGVAIGIVEDLIAVKLVTNEPITWNVIGVVVAVAIPFAFIGEVLVDQVDFIEMWEKFSKKKKKS